MRASGPFDVWKLLAAVALVPLYAAYGLYVVVSAVTEFVRWLVRVRYALRPSVTCRSCGHENSVSGRFECASCRAQYHGWVGRCPVCGAEPAWTPCDRCGVAVRLPWFHP